MTDKKKNEKNKEEEEEEEEDISEKSRELVELFQRVKLNQGQFIYAYAGEDAGKSGVYWKIGDRKFIKSQITSGLEQNEWGRYNEADKTLIFAYYQDRYPSHQTFYPITMEQAAKWTHDVEGVDYPSSDDEEEKKPRKKRSKSDEPSEEEEATDEEEKEKEAEEEDDDGKAEVKPTNFVVTKVTADGARKKQKTTKT